MQKVDYMEVAQEAMKQIRKGAFLTVKAGNEMNTMTIGWATIGFCWHKPVFMVAVRDSRHTFKLMEKAEDFTVTVPSGDMKDAIGFCGTKSGKDYDKFQECGLNTKDAVNVSSPVLDIPGLHYECKIMFKTAMDPKYLDDAFEKLYPEKDYHTLYFGEVVESYRL